MLILQYVLLVIITLFHNHFIRTLKDTLKSKLTSLIILWNVAVFIVNYLSVQITVCF